MKYSIIVPFYNRDVFYFTLLSYEYFYKDRNDIEILVLEDYKTSPEHHIKLVEMLSKFKKLNIKHHTIINNGYMATLMFNYGVSLAEGEFVILTCPECIHRSNIIQGLDLEFIDKNKYIICSCLSVDIINKADSYEYLTFNSIQWYQHSIHNNRRLHFCSALSKENYIKIKGFDEFYSMGISYDDDDFRQKVISANIPILSKDELSVYHIEHERNYQGNAELVNKNLIYYKNKWGIK